MILSFSFIFIILPFVLPAGLPAVKNMMNERRTRNPLRILLCGIRKVVVGCKFFSFSHQNTNPPYLYSFPYAVYVLATYRSTCFI